MEVKQIYQLINDTTAEALGNADLSVKDTTGLVDLGNMLSSDTRDLDMWFKKLWDKVGDTWVKAKLLEKPERSVLRREHDFGLYLEKISFGIADLKENPQYNGKDATSDPFNATSSIPVFVKMFKAMSTFRIKEPIPTSQLMTAFTDAYKMGAFISGLYTAIDNAMRLAEIECNDLAVNTNIAAILNNDNETQKRNLLAEYNSLTGESLTVSGALRNKDFLRWSAREIKQTIAYMQVPSTAFNATNKESNVKDRIPRQTSRDNLVVEMLSAFDSAYTTYLSSDTFHADMIALPNFEKVEMWQASRVSQSGTPQFDFNAVSSIAIKNDEIGEDEIEQSGIICFVHDIDSCASMVNFKSADEIYDPDQDRFITFRRGTKGYAVDLTENAVVFYLEEVIPPTPSNP